MARQSVKWAVQICGLGGGIFLCIAARKASEHKEENLRDSSLELIL